MRAEICYKEFGGGGVFTPRHVIIHELLCDQPLNVRHALYIVLKQLHILYLFPFSRVCVRVHCVFTPEKLVSQDFWGQGSSFRCSQKTFPQVQLRGGSVCEGVVFHLTPKAIRHRGVWQSSSSYSLGDVSRLNGSSRPWEFKYTTGLFLQMLGWNNKY